MAETTRKLGGGDVTITLNDTEYVLKPTLNAALTISRLSGGIRGAIDAVLRMDMEVIVKVISLGLGPNEVKKIKDLPDAVWRAGLTDNTGSMLSKCIEYLHILANGGRPVEDTEEEDSASPPAPA